MKLENMSPIAIAEELGNRLKQVRLNADLTQAEVASRAGLNRRSILNAEKGKVQLKNLVAYISLNGYSRPTQYVYTCTRSIPNTVGETQRPRTATSIKI